MRKIILVILFSLSLFAETITIQPIRVTKREEQNVMDIYYDLTEGYYDQVYLYFSIDMKNYKKVKGQSGDIGKVEPGMNKHIIWDMEKDFPKAWMGEMNIIVRVEKRDWEWESAFGGSEDEKAYSDQQTTDGGYIIAGYTLSFGAVRSNVYLIKTDEKENKQWQKTFVETNQSFLIKSNKSLMAHILMKKNTPPLILDLSDLVYFPQSLSLIIRDFVRFTGIIAGMIYTIYRITYN